MGKLQIEPCTLLYCMNILRFNIFINYCSKKCFDTLYKLFHRIKHLETCELKYTYFLLKIFLPIFFANCKNSVALTFLQRVPHIRSNFQYIFKQFFRIRPAIEKNCLNKTLKYAETIMLNITAKYIRWLPTVEYLFLSM